MTENPNAMTPTTTPPTTTTPATSTPTTITLSVEPGQTPAEEAQMVVRAAAAAAEDTGTDTVNFRLLHSEHVRVTGSVADRMRGAARWSA